MRASRTRVRVGKKASAKREHIRHKEIEAREKRFLENYQFR